MSDPVTTEPRPPVGPANVHRPIPRGRVAVVAVVTLLGIGAIIGIPIHKASDDRWRPQADSFMTVFHAASIATRGDGSYEQYSQLGGFVESRSDYLTGDFHVRAGDTTGMLDPANLNLATNLVAIAAGAAGYDYECRDMSDEEVRDFEDRMLTSLAGAHRQQCRLAEDGAARGGVVLVVRDNGDMWFDINAGFTPGDWY